MSLQLDWQQDVEDDDWSSRTGHDPPGRRRRTRLGLLAAGLAVIVGAAAFTVNHLSNRGQRAAQADVQEALTYTHWTLQQRDPGPFQATLDAAYPAWQATILAEWDHLSAWAQDAPPPEAETIVLHGARIDATVRWYDQTTGKSYQTWRWFRLAADSQQDASGRQEWRWTQPVAEDLGAELVTQAPHLTLVHHERDADVATRMIEPLDTAIEALCGRYDVDDCHFFLRWDVLDPAGQPLAWRDLPLPPLAEVISNELTGPIFIAGATIDDWRSTRMRQRLLRYFPGRGFISQSRLEVLRPEGQRQLPRIRTGEENHPIVLPTPWLRGVDDQGQPHPDWVNFTRRLLADAVMRRAVGPILGSPEYVNAAWALHQAVLAIETGQPVPNRLATSTASAPFDVERATLAQLSRLGSKLQVAPDEQAFAQLEDLSRYLQSFWPAEKVAALPTALGTTASLDRALNQSLGVDAGAFLRDWQGAQRRPAGKTTAAGDSAGYSDSSAAIREH